MIGLLSDVNMVSAVLIIVFLVPLTAGALSTLTRARVHHSLDMLLENIELAAGVIASVYFTKRIFFVHDSSIFSRLYDIIPEKIKNLFNGQDVLVYIVAVPFILIMLLLVIRFITGPLYSRLLIPISDRIYTSVSRTGPFVRSAAGALWQLPKAVVMTVVFALLLNFAMYYVYSPKLAQWSSESKEYQMIYNRILYPVLNSNLAKKIPVLVNDSFRRAGGNFISQQNAESIGNSIEKLTGGKVKIVEYFNGVTLDEAVKSDNEIDSMAVRVAGKEKDDYKKARLIYEWICNNIKYDFDKAERIANASNNETSGAINAFDSRKGICFDYSSLYVAMCRAVGLKVRLITGIGYSGVAWGDHAWNQVWYPDENRWINVDTTFGSTGINYFDKKDFSVDHRDPEIQGEWQGY